MAISSEQLKEISGYKDGKTVCSVQCCDTKLYHDSRVRNGYNFNYYQREVCLALY